jgi:hypothetical protein
LVNNNQVALSHATVTAIETMAIRELKATINTNKHPLGFSKARPPPEQRETGRARNVEVRLDSKFGRIAREIVEGIKSINDDDVTVRTLIKLRHYLLNSRELIAHENHENTLRLMYTKLQSVLRFFAKHAMHFHTSHPCPIGG